MKVYLSNYRNHWLSPYKICEKICFWREIEYEEPWVKAVNTVLEPIMTRIMNLMNVINPKIDYVKIDRWDTWSMDHTLSYIILPMLKQLKATKHGYPIVDENDGPDELRCSEQPFEEEGFYTHDANAEARWDWVLDEIIWAFEQIHPDNDWEKQFHSGVIDVLWKPVPGTDCSEMICGPNDTHVFDHEGYTKHAERIQNGLRLFGTYFMNLWD